MFGLLRPRVRRAFRLALRRRAWTNFDIDEELRLHVELRTQQLVDAGYARQEAEELARARFGPSWNDAVQSLHRSGSAREERLAMRERFEGLWYDLRYTVRSLRRAPRYAVAAIVTLALGLGATIVVFSLVDHILLRPLPYTAPNQLVVVRESVGSLRSVYPSLPGNASHFLEWRRSCTACVAISAIKRASYTLSTEADPERLGAARVSTNLLALLGVQPAIGRDFRSEEGTSGRERVAIISDALWHRQFNGDSAIVNRTVELDGRSILVIGVLPPNVGIPGGDALGALVGLANNVDLYMPLALTEQESRSQGDFDYAVLARLRDGASVEQARAQIDVVEQQFARRMNAGESLGAIVLPLQQQIVGETRRPLLFLLAAVGAMLLIVCVNLVNLTLARGAARYRESAIRVALGAGAARLVRVALIENLLLASVGGAGGLLLARFGLRTLVSLAPVTLPRLGEVQLDLRIAVAALVLTAFVGVVTGAFPAWRAGRTDPGDVMKTGGRYASGGRASGRRRASFIAAQVSCSTLLLIGTGLFITSFVRVMQVNPQVDVEHVMALDVALPLSKFPTGVQRFEFYERAISSIAPFLAQLPQR